MANPNSRSSWLGVLGAAAVLVIMVAIGATVALQNMGRQDTGEVIDDAAAADLREEALSMIIQDFPDKARPIVERLLEARPKDPEVHNVAIKLAMLEKQTEKAYEHATRSLKLKPAQGEIEFVAGSLAESMGRDDLAIEHYLKATRLEPDVARHRMYLAAMLLRVDKLDEAQEQCLVGIQLDSSIPGLYGMLAEIAAKRGKTLMAIDQVNKAIERAPEEGGKRIRYTLYKAQLLRRANEPSEALNMLAALPIEQKLRPDVAEQIAMTYLMMGRPEQAGEVWGVVFRSDTTNVRAAIEAGLCYVKAEDAIRAQRYLSLARRLDPDATNLEGLAKGVQRLREAATAEATN